MVNENLWQVVGAFLQEEGKRAPATLDEVLFATTRQDLGFHFSFGTYKDNQFSVDAIDWRMRSDDGEPYSYNFKAPSLEMGVLKAVLHLLQRRAGVRTAEERAT